MFAAEGAAVHEIDPAQLAYENAVGAAGLAATQAHDSAWVTAEDEFVDDQLADEEAVLSAAEAEDGAMISATVSWLTSVASAAKTAADANADAAMAMVIAIAGQTESVADTITQDAVTELEADNAANVAQVAADGAAIESYIASQPAGAPIFQLAAQSTTPQWHHLLPQEFRDQFTKIGINIDDARWGWILKPGDHADVHNEWWNTEWENFFKDNKSPTMKDVEQKLKGLFDTDEFLTIYKNGAKATMPFGDWKALTPSQKSSTFKNLLKATAFLGAVLGVLGAASDAQGALGPVLLLGDPVAQGEYQAALTALQEGRYQDAEQALFGSAEHDLSTIQSSNPNGLIPKMLSRMNDANPQSAPALWQLYLRARAKFSDLVRGANSGI
jgi:hypothetical protein